MRSLVTAAFALVLNQTELTFVVDQLVEGDHRIEPT